MKNRVAIARTRSEKTGSVRHYKEHSVSRSLTSSREDDKRPYDLINAISGYDCPWDVIIYVCLRVMPSNGLLSDNGGHHFGSLPSNTGDPLERLSRIGAIEESE
jgi:hypothetical protein